ncbi:MAG: hypothetical protein WBE96_14595, partial [Pseudolabrys sp.]
GLLRAAADKRGVTRVQPRIHDVRVMSACAPTADVSLQRGDRRFGPRNETALAVERCAPGGA